MTHSIIKTKKQISIMRETGKHLAYIMNELTSSITPGIETMELEKKFIKYCDANKLVPACKNYRPHGMEPFPTGLCVSLNEQSVHCYPKKGQMIKDGDIITIDTVIGNNGLYVDMAITKGAGEVSILRRNLIDTCEKTMYKAISLVKDGARTGLISDTIYRTVREKGYDVLREYAGHGIGLTMHEYPNIPCYGDPNEGTILLEGMTVCIEPLVTEGDHRLIHKENGWETETADKRDFVQFEHTVLVKKEGYEILTKE